MLTDLEREMLAEISGQRARSNVAELVLPEGRNAGSKAELDGANNTRDLLASLVDECVLEEAPVVCYQRGEG